MENNIEEKYLPIGSVVLLKNGQKELMITGYRANAEGKSYDYLGVIYPHGFIDLTTIAMFNHDSIVKVCQKGFVDESFPKVLEVLKASIDNDNK